MRRASQRPGLVCSSRSRTAPTCFGRFETGMMPVTGPSRPVYHPAGKVHLLSAWPLFGMFEVHYSVRPLLGVQDSTTSDLAPHMHAHMSASGHTSLPSSAYTCIYRVHQRQVAPNLITHRQAERTVDVDEPVTDLE